jgi:hypothetical protein
MVWTTCLALASCRPCRRRTTISLIGCSTPPRSPHRPSRSSIIPRTHCVFVSWGTMRDGVRGRLRNVRATPAQRPDGALTADREPACWPGPPPRPGPPGGWRCARRSPKRGGRPPTIRRSSAVRSPAASVDASAGGGPVPAAPLVGVAADDSAARNGLRTRGNWMSARPTMYPIAPVRRMTTSILARIGPARYRSAIAGRLRTPNFGAESRSTRASWPRDRPARQGSTRSARTSANRGCGCRAREAASR